MNKEFTYSVKYGFQYADGGDMVAAQSITVIAPNNTVARHVYVIEQQLNKSQMSLLSTLKDTVGEDAFQERIEKKSSPDEKSKREDADMVVQSLFAGNADIEAVMTAFEKILLSGSPERPTCVIDGKVKMTGVIFKEMTPGDTKRLLGEYIVNFISASQPS